MRTAEGRTRPGRKVWVAAAVLVVVVAGLMHGYRNTNALTGDRLCGGLVSTARADGVLPGSGRLDAEGEGLAEELKDTVCEVEKSSVVLGSGRGTLTLRVPLLIAAVKKAPGTSKGEAPGGREAEVVGRTGVVLPCARGELYPASESGLQYVEARKRHPDLPARDTYFESFVKSAAEAFGCGTSARR
ncbi:hypothetical protein ACFV8E_37550 [Streptomyces sp. NPDC059849]|uniref:hypothetical protein n=1 Tax=Streptomyces sp. NPDC059849 TaxID=3346969 RepID=UPI003668E5DF